MLEESEEIAYVEKIREKVLGKLDTSREVHNQEVYQIIDEVLPREPDSRFLSLQQKQTYRKRVYDSIRGLDVLQELLEQEDVTEIMVNGLGNIFVEKHGVISKHKGQFISESRLSDVIQTIAAKSNRRVNEASPIVDARLEDGSRVNIVLKPIALDGPVITIRRFPKESITMEKLIQYGSISRKTTFLNALSHFIPKQERIITIEDSAELQIQGASNLVRLEARQENGEGENGISIRDLIRTSLRMRP